MTKPELTSYTQKLVALRNRLAGNVASLAKEALKPEADSSGDLSHVPLHMADQATDSQERQFTLGLLENEEQTLQEIAAALQRIEEGTFGLCDGCQKKIAKARLGAIPYARFCVKCAERSQKGE